MLFLLAVLPVCTALLLPSNAPILAQRTSMLNAPRVAGTFMLSEEEKKRLAGAAENPNDYGVDFEFDATTVVALLGAAIAFNFFVLANL